MPTFLLAAFRSSLASILIFRASTVKDLTLMSCLLLGVIKRSWDNEVPLSFLAYGIHGMAAAIFPMWQLVA